MTGKSQSPGSRPLPAHIVAALTAQGTENLADSAGQPWAGRDLSEATAPYHRYKGDDGTAAADYHDALDALVAGTGSEAEVVAALAACRVFVPIVAELAEHSEHPGGTGEAGRNGLSGDKESDMVLVMLSAPDGRQALPVFSDPEKLRHWHPQARPVPVSAPRAALSAVSEKAQLMVVDPAAEQTFVVRRPALWAIAQQRLWAPSYQDAEVHARIRSLLIEGLTAGAKLGEGNLRGIDIMAAPGIRSVGAGGQLIPGGGAGPELRIVLLLRPGLNQAELDQSIARAEALLGADELFAQRVDSVQISVQGAGSARH
ncbi:SseB family protein [Acaricomes phytoseiuli]|uniref:SseB family protein n=1 Tax=Acaricomes phytoseiuli TaxID=291968 RepID=UPI0004783746|nr:SseB family protein [Acaricomes phytoseiuli]